MSYLFDLFLIQHLISREQILGVIIADYIKFSPKKKYDPLVEEGILYHSKMESFIKNHPSFNISKNRIDPKFNRFSNQIVKIYYSHFFAIYWENYSATELPVSVTEVYVNYTENGEIAPRKLKKLIPVLVSPSGITGLTTIGGIHNFIEAISSKGGCLSYLQNTLVDLVNNYNLFREDFEVFMKDFQQFAMEIRNDGNSKQDYYYLANAS
jgi:acyl carrier protein phosphodiesterase